MEHKSKDFFFSAAAEKVLLLGLFYRIFFLGRNVILKRIVLFGRGLLYRIFFSWRPECDSEEDSPFQQGAFLQNLFSRRPEGDGEKDSPFQHGAFLQNFFSSAAER